MKKPYSFAEYNLILENRKNDNLFKLVVIIFIIGIIILICKFKFYIYQDNILLKMEDNYELVADINSIDKISTSKKIFINNKQYDYNTIQTDDNLSNINGTIYERLLINIPDYTENNKIIKCSFLIKKETILDMLFEFIQGG